METSRDLLAAIGAVAVEAAKLEYAIAHLVVARRGLGDDDVHKMAKTPGGARTQLNKLVDMDHTWVDLRQLRRDTIAVLDDRHVLVHSVALETETSELEMTAAEFWHPRSNAIFTPGVAATEELVFDIGRCFTRAIRLIPAAKDRLTQLGPVTGVP